MMKQPKHPAYHTAITQFRSGTSVEAIAGFVDVPVPTVARWIRVALDRALSGGGLRDLCGCMERPKAEGADYCMMCLDGVDSADCT